MQLDAATMSVPTGRFIHEEWPYEPESRRVNGWRHWCWPLPPAEFHKRIFPWRIMHAPLLGPYLLGQHNALAGRGMYLSVVDRKKFCDEAQYVYERVFPDAATRLLTWTWPR